MKHAGLALRIFLGSVVAILCTGIGDSTAAEPKNWIDGRNIYTESCVGCHSAKGKARAPSFTSLAGMSPRAIVTALEEGKMRVHGESLREKERRAVAEWLTGRTLTKTPVPSSAYCDGGKADAGDAEPVWSGWSGDPEGTGFRTAEQVGFTAVDVPRLKLKWAFGFPDAVQSRSKPAIVGNLLIVSSQFGEIYALDVDSGCVHWNFTAQAGVRGAISVGNGPAGHQTVFFADFRTRVYALDVRNGMLLWKTSRIGRHPESSNTGSVVLYGGRVYVPISSMEVVTAQDPNYACCTSSGAVVALNAETGREIWRHRAISREAREAGKNAKGTPAYAPSGVPVWSSPTVDPERGLLYVGTGENYTRPTTNTSDSVLALDLETGMAAWRFQATANDAYNLACSMPTNRDNCPHQVGPDIDFGMAPMLTTRPDGSEILVAGQKSGVVFGLDPDQNGRVLWETRIGKGGPLGGVHWGMATDGRYAYATNADNPNAFLGIEPDVDPAPGVYALDLMTGEVVWKQPAPVDSCKDRQGCVVANSAAPTAMPGVVFAGGLDGHLRAYSTKDGTILWDYDTTQTFQTVNRVQARGGAIDGPGPVIANGMLFTQSGYGLFNQMPGNVLLAFEVAQP